MKARPYSPRAFLIYAALVCLCISDGIGPRLVPYPASGGGEAARQVDGSDSPGWGSLALTVGLDSTHQHQGAGHAFKKLPIFYAPPFISTRSSLIIQAAACLPSHRHISIPPLLPSDRGPPRLA